MESEKTNDITDKAGFDDAIGSVLALLCRLEDEFHTSPPEIGMLFQKIRGTQSDRNVTVMSAGMHDAGIL